MEMTTETERNRNMIAWHIGAHARFKVHFGAGNNILDGWLNTDLTPMSESVMRLDTTRPLPFLPGSADYLYSEHHLEHMTEAAGLSFLHECFRVLKRGGVLRVATPNLTKIADPGMVHQDGGPEYLEFISRTFGGRSADWCFMINNLFYNWGHRHLYDVSRLMTLLADVGFDSIETAGYKASQHTPLQNLEMHGEFLESLKPHIAYQAFSGERIAAFETLIIEARRP